MTVMTKKAQGIGRLQVPGEFVRAKPRRGRVLAVVAGAVAVCGAAALAMPGVANATSVSVAPSASSAAASWGKAIEVPGLGALNKGGTAQVLSVSCASTGNCVAGGEYADGSRHVQGFVADERNGRWGKAIEVPGLGALNTGGNAEVVSLSCRSAGNCAASGDYYVRHGREQGFVVSERHGTWGKAIGVPGLAAMNVGGTAEVLSVSCASAGNCAVGGDYRPSSALGAEGFVASQRNGRWGTAIKVPGLSGGEVNSVSCPSAGNCVVGGQGLTAHSGSAAFVADERNGRWGTAVAVSGLYASALAGISSVACASAGNCTAGGFYGDPSDNDQTGFVVSERHGTWGKAILVPGLADLNAGGNAGVTSVACPSAGNCTVGGYYADGQVVTPWGYFDGFVVSQRNGTWGKAILVPGLYAENGANLSTFVACASAGNCAAGGGYPVRSGSPFVASQRKGTWGKAIQVPGTLFKHQDNDLFAVACAPGGTCAAGGYYTDGSGHSQGFVVTQSR
jgi:hypothetical protein